MAIFRKNLKHSKSTKSIRERSLPKQLVSPPVLASQPRNQVESKAQLHPSPWLSKMSPNCHPNLRNSLRKNHHSPQCGQLQPRIVAASLRFNLIRARKVTNFTMGGQWPKDCLRYRGTATMSSIEVQKSLWTVTLNLTPKDRASLAPKRQVLAVSLKGENDISSNKFRKNLRSRPIPKSSHHFTNYHTWTVWRRTNKRLKKRLMRERTQKWVQIWRGHHWTTS